MTKQRNDNHSTEFGLWLRGVSEIDSKKGYIATNIDYIWKNYKTNQWIIIEEKRYGTNIKSWQRDIFKMLNWCCKKHAGYCGMYLIVFEKTSPEDGKIYINNYESTKKELLDILQFKNTGP